MNNGTLDDQQMKKVAGGNDEQFYNNCAICGKKWDMRKYGYGSKNMPEWVTGPWCPECRGKEQKVEVDVDSEQFYNTCTICGKKWDMRKYGYGTQAMPNRVTGPLCPECRKK